MPGSLGASGRSGRASRWRKGDGGASVGVGGEDLPDLEKQLDGAGRTSRPVRWCRRRSRPFLPWSVMPVTESIRGCRTSTSVKSLPRDSACNPHFIRARTDFNPQNHLRRPMATVIEEFTPRQRKTKYNYLEWLDGRIQRLEAGVDFHSITARSFANSLESWTKRQDIACVVRPVRDARAPGQPERWVEVWGDPSRSRADGPPAEIIAKLRRAGWHLRGARTG